jgi:hypothetical protein
MTSNVDIMRTALAAINIRDGAGFNALLEQIAEIVPVRRRSNESTSADPTLLRSTAPPSGRAGRSCDGTSRRIATSAAG